MAETTMETTGTPEAAALRKLARALDVERMKKIGSFHFAMGMGALTMWGAAEMWAQSSGWALARFAAVGSALVAGFVIPSTLHEWGHFVGARLSGAVSPVLERARDHFFLFDFDMEKNDIEQFTWMSWGGILAPWVLVLLALVFVPLGLTSGAVLFATLLSKAVATAVFEVPIARAAARSGQPGLALRDRLVAGGLQRGRQIGAAVGIASFALVWLTA